MKNIRKNTNSPNASPDRYLNFFVGHQSFAIPLLDVAEVIAKPKVESVANAPFGMLGLFTLRSSVIALFDMAKLLSSPTDKRSYQIEEAVIIGTFKGNQVGILVDRIDAVLAISAAKIESSDSLQSSYPSSYLTGTYQNEGKLTLIVKLTALIDPEIYKQFLKSKEVI